MAVSEIFDTTNQYIKYQITVTEGAVDVQNNTSPVSVSVEFWRTNEGYTTYGNGSVYCKINGVTYSASVGSSQKITSSGIILFSKSVTIPHNADGSKTLYVSAWIDHSRFHSSEQGFNVELTSIPRSTTPEFSVSTVDMGSTVTITLNRAASSFTHSLSYGFGALTNQTSGLSASTGVGTSATFTPPMTLANQIPNATSGTLTLTCKTYNEGNLIGTKTVSLTVTVPASVIPSFSDNPFSVLETVRGISSKFGALVQNVSKPQIFVQATALYSSSIVAYRITFEGQTKNANGSTFETIISSGSVSVTATVTDSRGRSNTASTTVTVLPYASPTISSVNVARCNQDGTENPEGDRVKVTFAFEISPVNNLNDKYYEIIYRETGTTSWNDVASGSVYSFDGSIVSGAYFDVDKSYDVSVNVRDYFSDNSAQLEVPTAFTLIDLRSTGKGIAFGKVSQKDAMEVAIDLDLTGEFLQETNQTPTLLNSWVNYGDGYAPASYWKDKLGIVHISGMIKSGATSAETVIFNLPAGYRPTANEKFFVASLNSICIVDVCSNGNVVIKTGANSGWISLFGISFRVS